jgi:hypothetical protein
MTALVRAFRLMVHPSKGWAAIAADPMTPRALLLRLILPLTLISAIATVVVPMVNLGMPIGWPGARWLLSAALLEVLLPVAVIYAAAFASDGFASVAHATRDWHRAFALAAFAATPFLLMGLFRLLGPVPVYLLFAALALAYAIVLVYRGASAMTAVPEDRVLPYVTAIVAFGALAFYFVATIARLLATASF